MKRLFVLLFTLCTFQLRAQTGIGTTTPDPSAKLEVASTNKGFLPPRVTLTGYMDITTIPNPATGLLVYNTGTNINLAAGYYYWNGNAWATIATAGGSGSFASSYLRGSRTAAQTTGLTNGGTVVFTQSDNASGNDISLNTSTGQITLAAGRTYRLIAQVPNYQNSAADSRPQFAWYNETSSNYIGSSSSSYSPSSAAGWGATGGLSEVIITTTSTTVVSYRIVQISVANQLGGNGDFSTTGSYPWFEGQVISGNAPVTGQSVDYGMARYSGADSGGMTNGQIVSFDATASGNLAWSGNKFTLKANKTYELESSLAIYQNAGGTGARFQIYDYTNSVALANGLFLSINGVGSYSPNANSPMKTIVTPTTDIQIGIKFIDSYGAGNPGIIGSTSTVGVNASPNASYFIAEQIGSSATVNAWSTNVPITISATTTAPTKGSSPTFDYVRYRNIGGRDYEIEYNYLSPNAGSAGSGDYLITLPGGLQFDFTAPGQVATTAAAGYNSLIYRLPSAFGDNILPGYHNSTTAIPYDSTRFRIHMNNWGSVGWSYFTSGNYSIGTTQLGFKMSFKFTAL